MRMPQHRTALQQNQQLGADNNRKLHDSATGNDIMNRQQHHIATGWSKTRVNRTSIEIHN
ncbi:hypothetical protein OO18_25935 [Raoultella ornithinolytica]|nr:hypothetical protein OO18_25935 [Raoultella ornithinolytica]KJG43716.1 hypothetical protein UA70_14410 [Raoultella planticola]